MLLFAYIILSLLAFGILVTTIRLSIVLPLFLVVLGLIGYFAGFLLTLLLATMVLLLLLLIGHLLSHGVYEIRVVTRKLGKARSRLLLMKTLWRWLPAFLLVLAVVLFTLWRDGVMKDAVYGIELSGDYACQNKDGEERLVCQNSASFEGDTHELASRLGNTLTAQLLDDIQVAIDYISKSSKDIKTELPRLLFDGGDVNFNHGDPLYSKTLPAAFKPPECGGLLGWLIHPGKCMKRMVLSPVNAVYSDTRQKTRDALSAQLNTVNEGVEGFTDEVSRIALKSIYLSNQEYQKAAHKTLDLAFLQNRISTLVFYAFIFYLLFKIFLYIFFRLAFDAKQGDIPLHLNTTINASGIKKQPMAYEELGNEASIALGDQTWFATKNRKVRYAQKGKPGFPMPLRLLFRRLLAGKYYMYRFGERFHCPLLEPYSDNITHFTKVSLQDSDSLCLNLGNLVAFSESVQLQSLFSIKLALFFKHSMFFTIAHGPGEVVLRIDGGQGKIIDGTDSDDTGKGYFNPVDLVAFDVNGSFELNAQHDLISVYSEGHTIRPQGNSLAIRQVHSEKGARSLLVPFRKILVFLLPF